jgi:hypothetical protein
MHTVQEERQWATHSNCAGRSGPSGGRAACPPRKRRLDFLGGADEAAPGAAPVLNVFTTVHTGPHRSACSSTADLVLLVSSS